MDDLKTARDLRAAAAYLRERGWIQGGLGWDGGPRCMAGALYSVIDHAAEPHWEALRFWPPFGDEFIATWNDAPGRTLDEVLDRLESTALALEVRALAADKPAVELVAVA